MQILKDCKFHHVGIVVKDLLNFVDKKDITVDAANGVQVAFSYFGDVMIELVEFLDDNLDFGGLIKNEEQIYHLAFSAKNIDPTLEEAQKNNFVLIHQPRRAKAFNNNKIYWFYHSLYGLIEIVSE